MANIPILAMLFGILGTTQIHLAKAMEKQGIEIFDQIKEKLGIGKEEEEEIQRDIKKPIIYTVGMVLHNTVFIWQILGTSYGLASHVTSMFGLGLIVLMIYSSKVLKEDISAMEYTGAAVLILGTVIIGLENINQQSFDRSTINSDAAILFFIIFIVTGIVIIKIALQTNRPVITGVLFGVFAGGCGCFDPVFKELGLTYGVGNDLLPIHPIGWIIYLSSFIVGFLGLVITQWGFARKAQASVLVPVYNSVYVTLPIFIQILTFPNYFPGMISILGIVITITGIIMMRAFKKEDNLELNQVNRKNGEFIL